MRKKPHRYCKMPTSIWIGSGGLILTLWASVVWLLYPFKMHGTGIGNNIEGVLIFSNSAREHREGNIRYRRAVPVGGPHHRIWLNCGIYDRPVSEENVVHSLEHGAIWIAYQPNLPTDQVKILREWVRQQNDRLGKPFVILAPKPGLDKPIAVTAWQVQLKLNDASDERLGQFLRQYWKGLFTPEPENNCSGGTGQPLD